MANRCHVAVYQNGSDLSQPENTRSTAAGKCRLAAGLVGSVTVRAWVTRRYPDTEVIGLAFSSSCCSPRAKLSTKTAGCRGSQY